MLLTSAISELSVAIALAEGFYVAGSRAIRNHNNDMTIQEIANLYTTTDQAAWAMTVASKLGISPDAKVSSLLTIAETGGIGIGILLIFVAIWYFRNHR